MCGVRLRNLCIFFQTAPRAYPERRKGAHGSRPILVILSSGVIGQVVFQVFEQLMGGVAQGFAIAIAHMLFWRGDRKMPK